MSGVIDWEVAVVYGAKDRYSRVKLWEDISRMHDSDSPLLVGEGISIGSCRMMTRRGGRPFSFFLELQIWGNL